MRALSTIVLAALVAAVLAAPQAASGLDLGVSAGAGIRDAGRTVGAGAALSGAVDATIGTAARPGTLAKADVTPNRAATHGLGAAVEIGLGTGADAALRPVPTAIRAVAFGY